MAGRVSSPGNSKAPSGVSLANARLKGGGLPRPMSILIQADESVKEHLERFLERWPAQIPSSRPLLLRPA